MRRLKHSSVSYLEKISLALTLIWTCRLVRCQGDYCFCVWFITCVVSFFHSNQLMEAQTSLHFYVGKYSKDSLYIEMETRLGSLNSLLPVAKRNSRVPDCRCTFQQNYLFLFPRRNHGMGDTSIKFEVIPGKNQKSEYVMTCGKHTVRGWCK